MLCCAGLCGRLWTFLFRFVVPKQRKYLGRQVNTFNIPDAFTCTTCGWAPRSSYSIRVLPQQLDLIRQARQDGSILLFSQYLCDDGFQLQRLAAFHRRLELVSRELVSQHSQHWLGYLLAFLL